MDTAGFPMLAKEKYELAQKEIEICDKISLIQRLGKLDLLTIDSPDFEALQTLFTSMKSVEEHGEDSFYLAEQNGDINNSKIEDVNEEHPAKRQRISNSHSDVAVGCIDDIDQSQPIYTHTATEGDWQSPEKAILEISFPSDSVSLTTTVHEKSCHGDDQVDQSVIGAVSQDADNASVTKTNELNLSAISNSSSINGSSLIHSTPSPELISQHHQNFRRYHSDGVDRRNLSREYDSDHQYPPPNQSKGGLVHEKEENGDLLTRRSITQ